MVCTLSIQFTSVEANSRYTVWTFLTGAHVGILIFSNDGFEADSRMRC